MLVLIETWDSRVYLYDWETDFNQEFSSIEEAREKAPGPIKHEFLHGPKHREKMRSKVNELLGRKV